MNPSMLAKRKNPIEELAKVLRKMDGVKVTVVSDGVDLDDIKYQNAGDPEDDIDPHDYKDFMDRAKGLMQAAGIRAWVVGGARKRKDAGVRFYKVELATASTQAVQGQSGEQRLFKARSALAPLGKIVETNVGVVKGVDTISVMIHSTNEADNALSDDQYKNKLKKALKAAGFFLVGSQAYAARGHHAINIVFR
jgi:hypothetical protein